MLSENDFEKKSKLEMYKKPSTTPNYETRNKLRTTDRINSQNLKTSNLPLENEYSKGNYQRENVISNVNKDFNETNSNKDNYVSNNTKESINSISERLYEK